jgi:nitroreductase
MERMMRRQFLDILRRRHACKGFIPGRELPAADLKFILEAGRLSPSSFGMEPWKFVVVSGEEGKRALQSACFDQAQVGGASLVVVILARLSDVRPGSRYVTQHLAREHPPQEMQNAQAIYAGFFSDTDVKAWCATQCHTAAANMMTAAAAIGIDSCPIGAFDEKRVLGLLGLSAARFAVALLLPLGYCASPPPPKRRLPLAKLVEYR